MRSPWPSRTEREWGELGLVVPRPLVRGDSPDHRLQQDPLPQPPSARPPTAARGVWDTVPSTVSSASAHCLAPSEGLLIPDQWGDEQMEWEGGHGELPALRG